MVVGAGTVTGNVQGVYWPGLDPHPPSSAGMSCVTRGQGQPQVTDIDTVHRSFPDFPDTPALVCAHVHVCAQFCVTV